MSRTDPLAAARRALRALASGASGRIFLGYSGGLDSTCLLHLAAESCRPRLRVLHINHGLHEDAELWQAHCLAACRSLNLPFEAARVRVQPAGFGLEAAAREARYQAFESRLAPGDLLLLAHHADDQAETVLFQLLRGGPAAGAPGMPKSRALGRGRLLRPLLEVPRSRLLEYARHRHFSWVEDADNLAAVRDRNFLRNQVLPLLRSRWPALAENLRRAGADLRALAAALAPVLAAELAAARRGPGLELAPLAELAPAVAREVFAAWLAQSGRRRPPFRLLDEMLRQLLHAAPDRHPVFSLPAADGEAARQLHRHDGLAWLLPPLLSPAASPKEPPPSVRVRLPETASWAAEIPAGSLRLVRGGGPGLRLDAAADIRIRFRLGGESIRLPGGRKSLKRLLQERRVPMFLRDRLPLLMVDGELAAIPGIGVSVAHWRGEGGWQFAWFSSQLERWWLCGAEQLR